MKGNFNVLSQHLSGETEKRTRKPQFGWPGSGSKFGENFCQSSNVYQRQGSLTLIATEKYFASHQNNLKVM
jgi:hypothetical protein